MRKRSRKKLYKRGKDAVNQWLRERCSGPYSKDADMAYFEAMAKLTARYGPIPGLFKKPIMYVTSSEQAAKELADKSIRPWKSGGYILMVPAGQRPRVQPSFQVLCLDEIDN